MVRKQSSNPCSQGAYSVVGEMRHVPAREQNMAAGNTLKKNTTTHLPLSPSPPTAHPIHAGVPEPLHPALCLSPGCHLLRHACVPCGPLAPGRGVLLHPEVLPGGVQVMAAFASLRGVGTGGALRWAVGYSY